MTTSEAKETSSATWKFEFADTVQADPLAKGACLAVIRSYLHFASKSNPQAFCSLQELMLRTGNSKPAIRRAKALLQKLGYLEPLYETEGGATLYRLVNCRKQVIDDHLRIARESLAAEKRDQKRRERKRSAEHGGNETITPENDNWERNVTPVWNETLPNTVEEYRREYSSEGREESLRGYDPDLQPPADLHEARIWLTSICTDKSRLAEALIRLAYDELTPEFLREIAA
jgi:hypothetical protein